MHFRGEMPCQWQKDFSRGLVVVLVVAVLVVVLLEILVVLVLAVVVLVLVVAVLMLVLVVLVLVVVMLVVVVAVLVLVVLVVLVLVVVVRRQSNPATRPGNTLNSMTPYFRVSQHVPVDTLRTQPVQSDRALHLARQAASDVDLFPLPAVAGERCK